jgi:small-conductance mechanosensitive channel
LTKVDAAAITLELRLHAGDAAARDGLRTKMLSALPRRFVEAKIGSSSTELPAFS